MERNVKQPKDKTGHYLYIKKSNRKVELSNKPTITDTSKTTNLKAIAALL
jgi:hypothetical protein